ncbi:hypothetical protein E4631_23975 [Hymenobacter sp. UV11]|uniref:hypothetical protein n=1 Tax=Hymenobacter sp. UV11 TaxID=1849735 RepID=UPI00105D27FB|nr:hypothetical protein [Hymenobacter sp. UV11]TDN38582.1 hypothetical protein A8B98_22825 [Hymenobacter sp. UV11]TFZ62989.1 hypothetical protein E4631_23975 [Hymenobacter sp. UV11]
MDNTKLPVGVPDIVTGKRRRFFETLLGALVVYQRRHNLPWYVQGRPILLADLAPELELLGKASTADHSAEQLLQALYYVVEVLAWAPDENELPF